ncbi:MAG: CAP family protein [Candidatus Nitrosocosmicus sp.]
MNKKISVVFTTILIITSAIFIIPSIKFQLSHAQNNQDLQSSVLSIHNQERTKVGNSPLTWSDSLANDAQQYAQHLTASGYGPNDILPHATGTGQGENLSWGHPGFYKAKEGVQQWADEKSNYRGQPLSSADFQKGKPMIGHYTQMVWKSTTQVGCGTSSSNTLEVLVCRYSPPGNYYGQVPYDSGSSSTNQAVTDDQNTFAPNQENTARDNTNTNTETSGNNNGVSGGETNNPDNNVNNNGVSDEGNTGR